MPAQKKKTAVSELFQKYSKEDKLRFTFALLVAMDQESSGFTEVFDSLGFEIATLMMLSLGGRKITIPRFKSFFGKAKVTCAAVDVFCKGTSSRDAVRKHKVKTRDLEHAIEIVVAKEKAGSLFAKTRKRDIPNAEECGETLSEIHKAVQEIMKSGGKKT